MEHMKDSIVSSSGEEETKKIESGVEASKEQDDNLDSVPKDHERWDQNVSRYLATIYCFIVMGMNDAAYGVSSVDFLLS